MRVLVPSDRWPKSAYKVSDNLSRGALQYTANHFEQIRTCLRVCSLRRNLDWQLHDAMMTREAARQIVDRLLRDVLLQPSRTFRGDENLTTNLRIDGDDLSFWFIPELMKAAGIRVPIERWLSVSTVDDCADVILEFQKQ